MSLIHDHGMNHYTCLYGNSDVKSPATISLEMSEIFCKLVLPQVISKEDHPVSVFTISCQKANMALSFAFKEHIDKTSKHPTIIGYQADLHQLYGENC